MTYDNDDEDTEEKVLEKDGNQIRKVVDGVEGEGCHYFEHCPE
jgi:hypothetical protein